MALPRAHRDAAQQLFKGLFVARFRMVLLHLAAVTRSQQGGETLQRRVLGLFIAGHRGLGGLGHLRRLPRHLDRRPGVGFGKGCGRRYGDAGGDLVDQAPAGFAVFMGRRAGITAREIGLAGLTLKKFNFLKRLHDNPRSRPIIKQ